VLGLKFQRQASDLIVTWDRDVATQFGAAAGLLTINDGGKDRAIGLSLEQLRSPNILFSPKGDQVQIQLTLLLADHRTLSESGMVIFPPAEPADRVVRSVAIPPRPVGAAEVIAQSPAPVAQRSFTPPTTSRTDAALRIDEPPAVAGSAVNHAQDVALPSVSQAVPRPPAPAPAPQPVTTAVAERPAAATQPDVDVKPVQLIAGGKPAVFPTAARNAHVQGTVVVEVTVSPDGKVKGTKIISGHPLLQEAAVDAVRSWRFRPAQINGKPVEGPLRLDINFHGPW
jgi:protein TonB